MATKKTKGKAKNQTGPGPELIPLPLDIAQKLRVVMLADMVSDGGRVWDALYNEVRVPFTVQDFDKLTLAMGQRINGVRWL